jgi:membrane dipeptidase
MKQVEHTKMLPPIIVDAHEDIAFSTVMLHRDFLQDLATLRSSDHLRDKEGTPTVCLPELIRGNVRVVFATIWVVPSGNEFTDSSICYKTAEEAHAQAMDELEYYRKLERAGYISIIETRSQLEEHLESDSKKVGFVLLMEGADPIRSPAETKEWFQRGIRIVGPAWRKTRYAHGTGEPGALCAEGRELVKEMESIGMILDISHLAEQSFFEALDLFHGTVLASHANSRIYVPTDRQLSDEMIREIIARDGVIGTVVYNTFLDSGWVERGRKKSEVTLATVIKHMQHVCDLAGDKLHTGIGSDFDGGFGLEAIPAEMDSIADLQKLGPALVQRGFTERDASNILGGNWLELLRKALP